MEYKISIITVAVAGVLIVGGMVSLNTNTKKNVSASVATIQQPTSDDVYAIVYKSPTCGCCEGHAQAMREADITVEVIEMQQADLLSLKQDYGISPDMMSCHTTILSHDDRKYVVEGHVPIEGIHKLLDEQPDISGIFLPGMPIGTPGMPGLKTGPYIVMTLEEEPELFVSL